MSCHIHSGSSLLQMLALLSQVSQTLLHFVEVISSLSQACKSCFLTPARNLNSDRKKCPGGGDQQNKVHILYASGTKRVDLQMTHDLVLSSMCTCTLNITVTESSAEKNSK